MTAIRETFEETGLLLACLNNGIWPSDADLESAREEVFEIPEQGIEKRET